MNRSHVHSMKPNRAVKPSSYACTSCAFRCTVRVIREVEANTRNHVVVRAGTPQARKIWDGEA